MTQDVTHCRCCYLVCLVAFLSADFVFESSFAASAERPNVVLIITDDQGWGDLGYHGNDRIKTPHLDALARSSAVLKNFYVSPVCTPTRASLMTGRYNYRTGAIDTYRGRALMHPEELTIAEMLSLAGYATGLFGKWHLGDNYPLRPHDQGFQEALYLWGGGLRQSADPPDGNSYFNPWLSKNGKLVKTQGYCSDVYTDAAIEFVERKRDRPFFVYLAYNCPHTPLEVREEDHRRYRDAGLDETTAKIYGMVANIDWNVGRLLARLDDLKLAENTIIIFMTDNGPQQPRYNGAHRGLKGSVYDGGIHVPCFVRWPARLKAGHSVGQIAAHIDIAPTLLAACGVEAPKGLHLDGRNLLPLLEQKGGDWPERHLFFQWHRGDVPKRSRAFAVRGERFKLVQAVGAGEKAAEPFRFELFDMNADPGEKLDIAKEEPEIVEQLKAAYDRWFDDVGATRGYDPPLIHLGAPNENPLRLSRQDLRGDSGNGPGYWAVRVEPGEYDVRLTFAKPSTDAKAMLVLEAARKEKPVARGESELTLSGVALPRFEGKLQAWIEQGEAATDVQYVELTKRSE
jgi:arylsulfatase A-like enzyme